MAKKLNEEEHIKMRAAAKEKSRIEGYDLKRYKRERDVFHIQNSVSESGWVGEVLSKPEAAILIDYFGIDVSGLSRGQENTLIFDVLRMSGKDERERKKRAIKDHKTTTKVIEKLKSLQGDIESLNRGFRGETHFSPFAAPDITLAILIFELSENERAANETIESMGGRNSRANPNSIYLCWVVIDIFLRWFDECVEEGQYGISYSPDYDSLKSLQDDETKDDTIESDAKKTELKKFIEHLQSGMVSIGYEMWDFGLTHPSRIALRQHKKLSRYLCETKLGTDS